MRLSAYATIAVACLLATACGQAWSEKPLAGRNREFGTPFSTTMAEEALPEDQLPKMVRGHPRLLLRPTSWKGGLSLDQVHERACREPWANLIAYARKSPDSRPTATTYRAFLYLAKRDESLVPLIVQRVLEAKPEFNCGGGLINVALWYDWIYDSPTVTDQQRKTMADHIAQLAYQSAKILESGFAFDIWTHRAAPGWAGDVLAAGLVLDDDHPEAKKIRAWGMGYFKKNYFRAWQHNDGCWLHGGAVYNIAFYVMPIAIACWASATEEDVYEVIRRDYGDWLQNHMYFQMAEELPDKTRSEFIAWDHSMSVSNRARQFGRNLMMIGRGYRNPDAAAWLRWIKQDPRIGPYDEMMRMLFYDEEIGAKPPSLPLTSPSSRLWGRQGPGYLQIRSKGWAPDSTVIEFKCGDFVWTHTHLNQSNAFTIYHKGRLAVQSGTYAFSDYSRPGHRVFAGNFFSHYFARSISGNSMLIFQPGEFTWPGAATEQLQESGAVPEPGGQRMPTHLGQNCFTFDEYLRRKTERNDTGALFETGDITAFEHAPDFSYTYVCGDATMAYNNPKFCYEFHGRENKPKVDLVTRSMAWLDNKFLVIFDRVNALDPSYRKAWLCHFQGMPKVSGNRIQADVPGHIEDFDGDTVEMTWADGVRKPPVPNDPGRLLIKTFLPKEHFIRRVGGDGYQFWSNGKNWMYEDPKESPQDDKGRWRIEVSPVKPANFDLFLNLLYPTDTRTDEMPPAAMVSDEGESMVGLAVGQWAVMFGRNRDVQGEVAYKAPANATEHLVVDLKRSAEYEVSGSDHGRKKITASRDGAVRFTSARGASIRLKPIP